MEIIAEKKPFGKMIRNDIVINKAFMCGCKI